MAGFPDPSVAVMLTWLAIVVCVSQSAMFSGLNLAFFSISRLRLEVEAASGNKAAERILKMRHDSNFLLTTILWGNVSINVLLTLLSESVMVGGAAFLFSTVIITLVGEIFPQAYFSRNALKIGALLSPLLRFYQFLLYPLAKPVALILDQWLGKEGIHYLREREMREMIRVHMAADETDLDRIESLGALNFLTIDDLPAAREGEPIDSRSIITLPFDGAVPRFPMETHDEKMAFLRRLNASGKKWVIVINGKGTPRLVLDADGFIRSALLEESRFDPIRYCHKPIIVRDTSLRLGHILPRLEVQAAYKGDNVIDRDVVLVWTKERRVITGADILGRLLSGISRIA